MMENIQGFASDEREREYQMPSIEERERERGAYSFSIYSKRREENERQVKKKIGENSLF